MKKLLIANLIVTSLLLVAVGFVASNQWRLDAKYDARYEWSVNGVRTNAQTIDHLLQPDRYPLPTAVRAELQRDLAARAASPLSSPAGSPDRPSAP